jgi:hypothetical protein
MSQWLMMTKVWSLILRFSSTLHWKTTEDLLDKYWPIVIPCGRDICIILNNLLSALGQAVCSWIKGRPQIKDIIARHWWLMPVTLAIWEAEIGWITVQGQPRQ